MRSINQEARGHGNKGIGRKVALSPLLLVALSLSFGAGCQQKMANQPYYRPLEVSEFYPDGRSSRPYVNGTVVYKPGKSDEPLYNGLSERGMGARKDTAKKGDAPTPTPEGAPDDVRNYVDAFPFTITESDLKRGAERYTIFCVPCHGVAGDGKGKIWERGYLKPTSFHGENSRGFGRYRVNVPMPQAPVGYYFEVITRGYGGMPSYSAQIPAEDRWRIIAYVRLLQLSQLADLRDLPSGLQATARAEADKAEAGESAEKKNGGH